ncbi:hypothetical protein [Halobacterium litoreum]|uniref:Uncharacterized protein n=1 Tax=Halobacterium litoreum TaxID=2039234 RepID=A0ABD5NBU4_9EURY|nr:hypothetical protein [Halobacterium litoreum]UHH14356.1 hypothetical protein LT972_04990 [Halobacterium litoreum]
MDDRIEALVDRLESRAGDGLRGVFYGDFRERDYTIAYASEDALDGYEPGHVDDVVDEVVLDVLSADRKETLHDPVGPLRCTVEVYDDGVNVVVLGYEAAPTVFVGLDGDVSNVSPVLDAVEETLR